MSSEKSTDVIFDLCIVGTGPAGIILAFEYARNNPDKKVALIEYGDETLGATNALDESIQVNDPINHHPPYECTNKGLGGTSATWGGRCVNYDLVDFIDRKIIRDGCTWHTELFTEVDAYLEASAKYFECGRPIFNLNEMPEFRDQRIAENFVEGIVTDSWLERWSMPTRFGKRYAEEINAQSNITLMSGYEGRDFAAPDDNGVVKSLDLYHIHSGEKRIIEARQFALAAGTQESTRILLRNLQLFKRLPTVPDALGKYYQGHISGKIATVKFRGNPKKTDYGFLRDKDGTYMRRRFHFDTDFLVQHNLLNTAIWLDNPLYHDPKHRSGAMSFMYLAMITPFLGRKLAPPAIVHSVTKGKVNGLSKHFWNVLKDLPGSLWKPASIFYRRYCLKRKLPGIFLYSPKNTYALHFHAEQVPDKNNKMQLSPDGKKLVIDYKLTDDDIHSVIKLHEVLDEWLRKCNCGELEYWFPKHELPDAIRAMSRDGIHQSGTTRIADTPEKGVIDKDLKLFGTENIYVCSSSAFPTSGQANPTFYLGAFAARLAAHLKTLHAKN
jgi:hypothetical protein